MERRLLKAYILRELRKGLEALRKEHMRDLAAYECAAAEMKATALSFLKELNDT